MSAADDLALIAQLRLHAPHSEDGYMLLRAANAIEDANARVALAHADALNEAAQWLEEDRWIVADQMRERARAIEVGEI